MINTGSNQSLPNISQPIAGENGLVDRAWYNSFQNMNTKNSSYGNGAPINPPKTIGDEYLDLDGKKMYKAFGVVSASDWILVN